MDILQEMKDQRDRLPPQDRSGRQEALGRGQEGRKESAVTPEEFENKLWVALVEAGQDCINEMRADHESTPERMKALERAIKTIGASRKLADVLLRAYQHVSHGGPTRAEVEAVLKEAGIL